MVYCRAPALNHSEPDAGGTALTERDGGGNASSDEVPLNNITGYCSPLQSIHVFLNCYGVDDVHPNCSQ